MTFSHAGPRARLDWLPHGSGCISLRTLLLVPGLKVFALNSPHSFQLSFTFFLQEPSDGEAITWHYGLLALTQHLSI